MSNTLLSIFFFNSSTNIVVGKHNTKKKIVRFFSYSVPRNNNDVGN